MRTRILAGLLLAALGLVAVPSIAPAAINVGGIGGPDAAPVPDPSRVYSATITLSADGTGATGAIVGTGTSSLGHANGITFVAGVTGKRIMLREGWCAFTFVTAAYTGGGTVSLRYSDTPANVISTTQTAAGTFLRVSNGYWSFAPVSVNNGASAIGAGINLASGAAFTAGGAGTASCTIYYSLVSS